MVIFIFNIRPVGLRAVSRFILTFSDLRAISRCYLQEIDAPVTVEIKKARSNRTACRHVFYIVPGVFAVETVINKSDSLSALIFDNDFVH